MRFSCCPIAGFLQEGSGGSAVVAGDAPCLWLVGSASASEIRIVSAADASLTPAAAWLQRLEESLPVGLSVVGVFCPTGAPALPKEVPSACRSRLRLVAGPSQEGALEAWSLEGSGPTKLAACVLEEQQQQSVRGKLRLVGCSPRQLQRISDDLPRSLRLRLPGSNAVPTLEEMKASSLPLPAGRMVDVELLAETLGAAPTNVLEASPEALSLVELDAVAEVEPGQTAAAAAGALIKALQAQLSSLAGTGAGSFRAFLLPQVAHALCIRGSEEKALREGLHRLWRLPQAPLLLPDCSLPWLSARHPRSSGKLLNPHLECGKQPGWWKGGEETRAAFARGLTEYAHYMQDNFNDDGWGCAYRSLQTCVSWFRLNFYSDKAVPSIPQIQEHLKRIDEAHKDLKVGSRQWIGSVEVMYLMQDYLGLDCKMMYCQDQADLASQAPQLLSHLETEGTPVMMGAGDYAYTLVGIRYDPASGEVAFLILDPHYTGSDDLKNILQKGWVGWKNISFFAGDGKFINCCLPMVPTGPDHI